MVVVRGGVVEESREMVQPSLLKQIRKNGGNFFLFFKIMADAKSIFNASDALNKKRKIDQETLDASLATKVDVLDTTTTPVADQIPKYSSLAGLTVGKLNTAFNTLDDGSGNVTVAGTMGVTGVSTLGAMSATTATVSGTLGVTGTSNLGTLSAGATTVSSMTVSNVATGRALVTSSGSAVIGIGYTQTGANANIVQTTSTGGIVAGGAGGFSATGAAEINSLLTLTKDVTSSEALATNGHLMLRAATNTNRQLLIGYNNSLNEGYIQSVQQGVNNTMLALNAGGGTVRMGGNVTAVGSVTAGNSGFTAPGPLTLTGATGSGTFGGSVTVAGTVTGGRINCSRFSTPPSTSYTNNGTTALISPGLFYRAGTATFSTISIAGTDMSGNFTLVCNGSGTSEIIVSYFLAAQYPSGSRTFVTPVGVNSAALGVYCSTNTADYFGIGFTNPLVSGQTYFFNYFNVGY